MNPSRCSTCFANCSVWGWRQPPCSLQRSTRPTVVLGESNDRKLIWFTPWPPEQPVPKHQSGSLYSYWMNRSSCCWSLGVGRRCRTVDRTALVCWGRVILHTVGPDYWRPRLNALQRRERNHMGHARLPARPPAHPRQWEFITDVLLRFPALVHLQLCRVHNNHFGGALL